MKTSNEAEDIEKKHNTKKVNGLQMTVGLLPPM